jgi:hypothetical protein
VIAAMPDIRPMRTTATYDVECFCGKKHESQTPHIACSCGRHIFVDWQPKTTNPKQEEEP